MTRARSAGVRESSGPRRSAEGSLLGGRPLRGRRLRRPRRLPGERRRASPLPGGGLELAPEKDRRELEADRMADLAVRGWPAAAPAAHPDPGRPEVRRATRDPEEDEERRRAVEGNAQAGTEAREVPAPEPRKEEEEEEEPEATLAPKALPGRTPTLSPHLAARISGQAGRGRALPRPVRGPLEHCFAADFSRVRVHTDPEAEQLAAALGARAFTLGREITFGRGEYRPETRRGRWLLAHELAHVVQQARPGPHSPCRRVRRTPPQPAAVPAPAAVPEPAQPQPAAAIDPALQAALEGDDDDVRALTLSSEWGPLQVTAPQGAGLLANLLTGVALDEDEAAGLRVLRKALAQGIFEATLEALDRDGRFWELIEDYHGEEYRSLLDLLSGHIDRLSLKARYLDKFLDMFWVRQHEERAIVTLLERTSTGDLVSLLTERGRLSGLRSAIDNAALSKRYERVVAQANLERITAAGSVETSLAQIFEAAGRKAVGAGLRSREEVDRLVAAAALDLAAELKEHHDKLQSAITAGKHAEVARLNRQIERRLESIVEQKSAEFGLELKYNVEFNRSTKKALAQIWTRQDLRKIDRLLAEIPPEILGGLTDLGIFGREKDSTETKYAGQARGSEIALVAAEGLTLGTVAHEIGHFVHRDAPVLYEEFQALSSWMPRTRAEVEAEIPKTKLATLDREYCSDNLSGRVRHGASYYRFRSYPRRDKSLACSTAPAFYRYREDARFVSDYAATDPKDDFAESFTFYIEMPSTLRSKSRPKYDFMHVRIFVEYWLRKQIQRLKKSFDDEIRKLPESAEIRPLWREIRERFFVPLRNRMTHDLEVYAEGPVELAEAGKLTQHLPLKGFEGATKVAQTFIALAGDLAALGKPVLEKYDDFRLDVSLEEVLVDAALLPTLEAQLKALDADLRKELLELMAPVAQKILEGQRTQKATLPGLDALAARFGKSVGVAGDYSPLYRKVLEALKKSFGRGLELLGQHGPRTPPWETLRQFLSQRIKPLRAKLTEMREQIEERVKLGKPFKAENFEDPEALVDREITLWERFARELVEQKSGKGRK